MCLFSRRKLSVTASKHLPPETRDGHPFVPQVTFDGARVTNRIKSDLWQNLQDLGDFDEANLEKIYVAALISITRGRDLAILYTAIVNLNLPSMTKCRAVEISQHLNNKATALMEQDRQQSLAIDEAVWIYSGAPCGQHDFAHKAAHGKRYPVSGGMLIGDRKTLPGREDGCKCISRAVVPGFE